MLRPNFPLQGSPPTPSQGSESYLSTPSLSFQNLREGQEASSQEIPVHKAPLPPHFLPETQAPVSPLPPLSKSQSPGSQPILVLDVATFGKGRGQASHAGLRGAAGAQ